MRNLGRKQDQIELRLKKMRDSLCFKNVRVLSIINTNYKAYDFFANYWDTDIKSFSDRFSFESIISSKEGKLDRVKAIARGINGLYSGVPSEIKGKPAWLVYLASQFRVINSLSGDAAEIRILGYSTIASSLLKKINDLGVYKLGYFKGTKISELSAVFKFSDTDLRELSDLLYLNGVTDTGYFPEKKAKGGFKFAQIETLQISKIDADVAIDTINKTIDVFDALINGANLSDNSKKAFLDQINGLELVKEILGEKKKTISVFGNDSCESDKSQNFTEENSATNNEKDSGGTVPKEYSYDKTNRTTFTFDAETISKIEIKDKTSLSVLVDKINQAYGNYCISYKQLIKFLASIGLYEENNGKIDAKLNYLPTEDGEFNGINLSSNETGSYRIYLTEKGQRNILLLLRDFETSKYNVIE